MVVGLRCVLQRASRFNGEAELSSVVAVLDDVVREFGLNAAEREDILGDYLTETEGGAIEARG